MDFNKVIELEADQLMASKNMDLITDVVAQPNMVAGYESAKRIARGMITSFYLHDDRDAILRQLIIKGLQARHGYQYQEAV